MEIIVWGYEEMLHEAEERAEFGNPNSRVGLRELDLATRSWGYFEDLKGPTEGDAKMH